LEETFAVTASNRGKEYKKPSALRGSAASPPLIENLAQKIVDYRLPLAAAMLVIAVILGYIGHDKYLANIGEDNSFWDIFYYTLRLLNPAAFPLHGPLNTEIQIARFLAIAATVYIAAEALLSIFRDQVQHIRIQLMKNHIIICGLGQKGLLLADRYRMLGEPVVVIEKDESNPMIGHCFDRGMVVLTGNAADPQLLRKARVHRAKSIISVCGSDGTNAEVALNSRQLSAERKGRALSCIIHIVNLQLWNLIKERELRMGVVNSFRLGFINIYENGARSLLYSFPPFGDADKEESSHHILVVGIGRLGESLVVNAAIRWKYSEHNKGSRLRISLLDKLANSRKEAIILRYPQIENCCELIPLEMDAASPEFQRGAFLYGPDGRCGFSRIYVCLGNESDALAAALELRRHLGTLDIPIIVRMNFNSGLSSLLGNYDDRETKPENVYVFALLEDTCTPELISGGNTIEILAQAFHNDYLRNAARRGETPQMNPSVVPWDYLSDNLKESNRNQAEHITVKLRQFGYDFVMTSDWDLPPLQFSPGEIEEMAKIEHTRFVNERLCEGWRYGSPKDDYKKISPTLIPWEQLSDEEKDKDRNPVIAIPEFLARAGFRIYRSGQSR
jgi:voltage-gated potassium channel Kch